jgi:hypothetical protein
MAHANGLALIPDGEGVVAGGGVDVLLLDDGVPDATEITLAEALRHVR